jgi:hypothetical protein
MDVSRCQNALPCPDGFAEWADWLAVGLHGRNRWRLVFVLSGILFATGRRTVTSWLRAAGVCTDYKAYYYFLGSVGRNSQCIAGRLLWRIFREAEIEPVCEDRVLFAIDDSPTKRYGPMVEGAGVHHNPTPGPADQKYVYGHVWVTLALIARHPWWGAIGLPILSKLYVRRKNLKSLPKRWPFQTKLEQAAEMVEWVATCTRFYGKMLWIVVASVHLAGDFAPAAPTARTLRQADPLLAVLSRPAALTRCSRRRQIEQSGIFSQAADHHCAREDRPFQKRPFGISAIVGLLPSKTNRSGIQIPLCENQSIAQISPACLGSGVRFFDARS